MSEGEVFYQVKQILESLNEEDYNAIPKEAIEMVNAKAEEVSEAKLDMSIPLEMQDINVKVYEVLMEILNVVPEEAYTKSKMAEAEKVATERELVFLRERVREVSNSVEFLKRQNDMLKAQLNQIPPFIRKMFIKNSSVLLPEHKM